jgi:hypothetical protein
MLTFVQVRVLAWIGLRWSRRGSGRRSSPRILPSGGAAARWLLWCTVLRVGICATRCGVRGCMTGVAPSAIHLLR